MTKAYKDITPKQLKDFFKCKEHKNEEIVARKVRRQEERVNIKEDIEKLVKGK